MLSLQKSWWGLGLVRSVPGPGVRSGGHLGAIWVPCACGFSEGQPGQADTGPSPVCVSVHTHFPKLPRHVCARPSSQERAVGCVAATAQDAWPWVRVVTEWGDRVTLSSSCPLERAGCEARPHPRTPSSTAPGEAT